MADSAETSRRRDRRLTTTVDQTGKIATAGQSAVPLTLLEDASRSIICGGFDPAPQADPPHIEAPLFVAPRQRKHAHQNLTKTCGVRVLKTSAEEALWLEAGL